MGWEDDQVVDAPASADWQHDPVMADDKEPPSMLAVAGNAAWKGMAGTLDMGLNVAGSVGNALIPPGLRPGAMKNPIHTALTALGAIRPENEPQTAGQRILDTGVQAGVSMLANPAKGGADIARNVATGIIGGLSSSAVKEATGSDLLAFAVGMVTPMLADKLVASGAKSLQNAVGKATRTEAMEAGYVVPPSLTKPSFATNRVESIAGKAAVLQDATMRNSEVTTKLAARSIGLPENAPITPEAIEGIRQQAGKVYAEVQALNPATMLQGLKVKTVADQPMLPGPQTGIAVKELKSKAIAEKLIKSSILDERGSPIIKEVIPAQPSRITGIKVGTNSRGQDIPGPLQGLKVSVNETRGINPLDELKDARAQATQYYKHYDRSALPDSLKQAKAFTARANILENQIEEQAKALGKPELVNQLRAARTLIARTHDVERALNVGDGTVSAQIIGRMLDSGRPLTGDLKVIGKFAQAFPKVTRDAAMTQSPSVSGMDPMSSAVLGGGGFAVGGPAGAAIGAGLPLLRAPMRNLALSQTMQNRLLRDPEPLAHSLYKGALIGRSLLDYQEAVP